MICKSTVRLACVLGLCWGTIGICLGQTQEQAPPTESQDVKVLNALYGDFAAPDLTAPTLLGVNASQVSKPANIKAFAANIIGAVASFPEKGKGLGIEIAPAQFFQRTAWKQDGNKPPNLTESLQSYASWTNQLGRNFTLSGAQISTDSSAKVAAGGALVLLDRTDPLLDATYIQKASQALASQEALKFIALSATHNNAIDISRTQVYLTQNIYNNAWPDAQRQAARPLLKKVEEAMNTVGLLPESPQALGTPEAFNPEQDKALKALSESLKKLQSPNLSPNLNNTQVQALVNEATKNVESVKANYREYYDARQQATASTNSTLKTARDYFDKKLWNASIIQVGGGWTWGSANNTFNTLKARSGGGFLRTALRLADKTWEEKSGLAGFMYWHTQLVLNIQYQQYQNSATKLPVKSRTVTDSLDSRLWYGARLLVGGAYFRMSIEGSVQNLSYNQLAEDAIKKVNKQLPGTIYSATIGAEVRLVDKLWLEFAIGSAKPSGQNSQLLALSSLKYAIRNSQRFKTN
ncbi:hypothetical protein [Hymenobacter baengnokdamensis]|uniref:hypothetical protein n=1 Tax=Hymenobacter baengnokdamensis TaxID=2615203 RepID=UPI0012463F2A|nr:hypothetical protein [Hymenobacter baengnokdamensis]